MDINRGPVAWSPFGLGPKFWEKMPILKLLKLHWWQSRPKKLGSIPAWYINVLSMCGPSFNLVCLSFPEKREMKLIFFYISKLERKKNEEIKGRISRRNLVLFHIKQQMIHNICTKLQNPTCNSSWEIFVTNFPIYYTGVRDGKNEKEGKINLCFVFCPTIYLATQCIYKIWRLWLWQKLRNL